MRQIRIHSLFLAIVLIGAVNGYSQDIFMGVGCPAKFFADDSVTFFNDVIVEGSFSSDSNSDLIFVGERWENRTTSSFGGDGRFTFLQPSLSGTNYKQQLGGVSWDNRFPNLLLRNPNDLDLFGVSGARDSFTFDSGHVFHNKFDFIVGDGNPGVILGYDETKYFVTNHDNTTDSGFLVRQDIGGSFVDFPVGNAVSDYTPARMNNAGDQDTFYVRVFPNVYVDGNTGLLENSLTVQRTWNILENTEGGSDVGLSLQHNASTEGGSYSSADQYVARYYGVVNNAYKDTSLSSKWDYAASGNGYANVAGDITTGATVGHKATRSINITSVFGKTAPTRYFTKASTLTPVPVELLYFDAVWKSTDAAKISWSTATEINNSGFEVYRSFDGVQFDFLTWQESEASGGYSNEILDYSFSDENIPSEAHTIYYKLVQIDYDGKNETFGPRVLRRAKKSGVSVHAYPVPAKSEVYISLAGEFTGDITYRITNALGQEVYSSHHKKSNYQTKIRIPVSGFSKGAYWIQFVMNETNSTYIKPIEILIIN